MDHGPYTGVLGRCGIKMQPKAPTGLDAILTVTNFAAKDRRAWALVLNGLAPCRADAITLRLELELRACLKLRQHCPVASRAHRELDVAPEPERIVRREVDGRSRSPRFPEACGAVAIRSRRARGRADRAGRTPC